ncbi:hypothetical protein VKT23_006248 [Stygiomarasmius scandens]|uniref:Uncharacterized protein n=1 Tax=Marasmiellus scandens TaxID=2682957 RepID=A0ABR1JPB0_9AGAR
MFMSRKIESILFLLLAMLALQATAQLKPSQNLVARTSKTSTSTRATGTRTSSSTSPASTSSSTRGSGTGSSTSTSTSSRATGTQGSGSSEKAVKPPASLKLKPPKEEDRNGPGTFGTPEQAGYDKSDKKKKTSNGRRHV